MHQHGVQPGDVHVRVATGDAEDGCLRSSTTSAHVKQGWMSTMVDNHDYDQSFFEVLDALEVDYNCTYATARMR